MPTKIYLEARQVSVPGTAALTAYWHLYLVESVADASGKVIQENVIRGGPGGPAGPLPLDSFLATQANIPLSESDDKPTPGVTPARVEISNLGGRDATEVWNIMTQHAKAINSATNLRYDYPVGQVSVNWNPTGNELNSNTVAASVLHTVGIDINPYLQQIAKIKGLDLTDSVPRGGDFIFVNNTAAMNVSDVLAGSSNHDVIWGGAGNDILMGLGGNDELSGDAGNDRLYGGPGNDTLTGGAGADVFVLSGGNDTITDFNFAAGDRIQIPKGTTPEMLFIATSANASRTVLTHAEGSLTLTGPVFNSLTSLHSWFVAATNAPEIVQTQTFSEGGLVYFKLNFTDPNNDPIGFGFRGIKGAGWAPEEHLFTSPSYGRVSPGQVEYPFNLLSGTPQAYQSDVAAYVFDAAGNRSPEVAIHLA